MIELPRPLLIGMVHLPALPGSPSHHLPMSAIVDRALRDAEVLRVAGYDALMVENFGDSPFQLEGLDPATIAALAVTTARIREVVAIPVGVNALRNDARAALGIAAATGAAFIRVNVHVGVSATDQGIAEGRAAETLRYRRALGADVGIFADVHVKHALLLSQPDVALAAEEIAYRGLAEALIVTGPTTGRSASLEDVSRVKRAVPDRLVLAGSGVNAQNVGEFLRRCDGVIVGTSIKEGGLTLQPVDPKAARALVQAARG